MKTFPLSYLDIIVGNEHSVHKYGFPSVYVATPSILSLLSNLYFSNVLTLLTFPSYQIYCPSCIKVPQNLTFSPELPKLNVKKTIMPFNLNLTRQASLM